MNQALGHLETLCALDHVDEAAEAQAQAEVSHLRTKQSSLRQMYEIVVLKLSDDSEIDVDGGSPGLSPPDRGHREPEHLRQRGIRRAGCSCLRSRDLAAAGDCK